MILATLGTSMVKVLVVTRCHAQYGAVHNHRDLCDTPLVNRLLKDGEKARLFWKQEADGNVVVGVSSEVQDEILEKKQRTTANDSK